ncbi:MAG: EAL domain-containing protein [Gammaproteobacteria bacterium]|nr:EAL domain-containing protein [Gammaproteobacteria bacterium]
MAFQPIWDIENGTAFAYEALVRPSGGGSALEVLEQITEESRYAFDQSCRVKAIELAGALGMQSILSINFLPNAVYQPAACLRKTIDAAHRVGFPTTRLMFEVTESEPSRDPAHLRAIFTEYRAHGMITAIDDFGAGHSGLNMLADFQPNIVKLDMALCRNLDRDPVRRAIARSIINLCGDLGIDVVCEGIETLGEAVALRDLGVRYLQGFLFAKPAIESLPEVSKDILRAVRAAHEDSLLDRSEPTPRQACR